MKNLNIAVVNCKATYLQRDGFIVCGNSGYTVTFTFDSEWDAHTAKTARFKWNNEVCDVVFSGNIVDVPKITDATQVEIGVFSTAGDYCTTTPAIVPCLKSILCGSGAPTAPTTDVYSQLIDLLNSGAIQGERGEDGKTPTFTFENDELKVSYDDGKTWSSLVKISGAGGGNGITPHIGENGNWWIGETDTAVKAEGENGVSITKATINESGELVLTFSNGTSTNLGKVVGGGGSDHTPDGETLIVGTDGKTSVYGIYPKVKSREGSVVAGSVPINLFIGDQAEYNTLPEEDKQNLFALIQDDNAAEVFNGLVNASYTVGLEYTLNSDDKSYSCSKIGTASTKYITIPSYNNGLPVTGILSSAFKGNPNIISINIPDTVTNLADGLFNVCTSLRSIKLGRGITKIPNGAFAQCTSLVDVIIPENCIEIGGDAFNGCESLGTIFIPKSVTSIADTAFSACSYLTIYVERGANIEDNGWYGEYTVMYNAISPNVSRAVEAEHARFIRTDNIVCTIEGTGTDTVLTPQKTLETGGYMLWGTVKNTREVCMAFFGHDVRMAQMDGSASYFEVPLKGDTAKFKGQYVGDTFAIYCVDAPSKFEFSYVDLRKIV